MRNKKRTKFFLRCTAEGRQKIPGNSDSESARHPPSILRLSCKLVGSGNCPGLADWDCQVGTGKLGLALGGNLGACSWMGLAVIARMTVMRSSRCARGRMVSGDHSAARGDVATPVSYPQGTRGTLSAAGQLDTLS